MAQILLVFSLIFSANFAEARGLSCRAAFQSSNPAKQQLKQKVEDYKKIVEEFFENNYSDYYQDNFTNKVTNPRKRIYKEMKALVELSVEARDSRGLKEIITETHQSEPSIWMFHSAKILEVIPRNSTFWKSLDFSAKHITEYGTSYLSTLMSVPLKKLPLSMVRALEKSGLLHLTESNTVHLKKEDMTFKYIFKGRAYSGSCTQMCGGHLWTLVSVFKALNRRGINDRLPEELEKYAKGRNGYEYHQMGMTTFIRIPGHGIVGAMKQVGDKNMLALKNVVDTEGRVILVAGNTYTLSRRFVEKRVEKHDESAYAVVDFYKNQGIHGLVIAADRIIDRMEKKEARILNRKVAKTPRPQKRRQFVDMLSRSVDRISEDMDYFRELVKQVHPDGWGSR